MNLATCHPLELVEAHAESITGRPVEHIAPVVCLDDEGEHQMPAARGYPPEVLAMRAATSRQGAPACAV